MVTLNLRNQSLIFDNRSINHIIKYNYTKLERLNENCACISIYLTHKDLTI